MDTKQRRIISVITDNEFGVLARVVSLFSARGYNIESLSVAEVDKQKAISRITVQTMCSEKMSSLLVKLLHRLIPVISAEDITNKSDIVTRHFAICKVDSNVISAHKVLLQNGDHSIVEISANTQDELDAIIKSLNPIEIVKSGLVAI